MSRDDPRPGREPAIPREDPVEIAPGSDYDSDSTRESSAPAWDADDPRRCRDQFAPPQEPCECWCMHCRRTFMSDGIWFQRVVNDPHGFEGFWRCPTPNCDGAGFTFDIFPTDPDHPANEGWCYSDDDDEEDEEDPEAEPGDELFADASDGTADAFDARDPFGDGADGDWDPDESKYKELDEIFGEDDDIEGEEWKYGLQPGERPPEPAWAEEARREQEEQERRYNEPDERPRVVDWSDRADRHKRDGSVPFDDNDIPF